MLTKEQFFIKFRSMAEQDCEVIKPSNPSAWILKRLDSMWNDHCKWYKEQYPQKYRESLTLEQLARL